MSNQSGPPPLNPSGPSGSEPTGAPRAPGQPGTPPLPGSRDTPPNRAPQGRDGVSPGVVMALVAAAVVVGLAVLAVLVWLLVRLVSPPGTGDPERPTTTEQAAEPTAKGTVATTPAPSPSAGEHESSSVAPEEPHDIPGKSVAGAQVLTAPAGEPLAQKNGRFQEMTLETKAENAIEVPDRDEPLLVEWSARGGSGTGIVFLAEAEREGGQLTGSLTPVRSGQTGTALINHARHRGSAAVLYAKGNAGMSWNVTIRPLSAIPELRRNTPVTGDGPGVFRLPAGAAQTYSLEVTADHDVPSVEVYEPGDLGLSEDRTHGTSPVTLDVQVAGGERIVVVDSQKRWVFSPR